MVSWWVGHPQYPSEPRLFYSKAFEILRSGIPFKKDWRPLRMIIVKLSEALSRVGGYSVEGVSAAE